MVLERCFVRAGNVLAIVLVFLLLATWGCGRPASPQTRTETARPYELVLVDERIVFGKDDITIHLVVRDLGVRKMIAPDLYWGLSLVWDGKEYERDPKYKGNWNGPWEIIPRTAWRTGISVSAYRVPPDVLTPGRHVLSVKDEFSESNAVTIFIETAKKTVPASRPQESPSRQLIRAIRQVEDEHRGQDLAALKAKVAAVAKGIISAHGMESLADEELRVKDDAYPVKLLVKDGVVTFDGDTRIWRLYPEIVNGQVISVRVTYIEICRD